MDPEKTRKEMEYTDSVPDAQDRDGEYEKTYRDGSLQQECWDSDR